MSQEPLELVEGWTDPIDYQLRTRDAAGVVSNLNLAGKTVTLKLYDARDKEFQFGGTVQIIVSADGKVRFNPVAGDLRHSLSPYKVRWHVTIDATGKVAMFPRKAPELWTVRLP